MKYRVEVMKDNDIIYWKNTLGSRPEPVARKAIEQSGISNMDYVTIFVMNERGERFAYNVKSSNSVSHVDPLYKVGRDPYPLSPDMVGLIFSGNKRIIDA